ncbi:MAG TPA: hypothetical protein ENJ91_05570 [Rhodobacteraceae bacterium]|nr:hypothetical protein [Paracoccaceae bacterium]
MLRLINAFFLSLTLAFTSYSFAVARGENADFGVEMVICTGVGITTITLGPDGEPVEKTHICPDGMMIFASANYVPPQPALPAVMKWRFVPPAEISEQPQETLAPLARGPPRIV